MAANKLRSIGDLARLAGVSKSTVSRALNNSPLVGSETKEKIVSIAKEHGFRPSSVARNLSLRSSHSIAFANHAYSKGLCSISDPFSLEIMGGIAVGLSELGYDLLVLHVDPDETDWAEQYFDSGKVDGFIVMTSTKKRKHVDHLLARNIPFIAWGPGSGEFCTVCGDDKKGGRIAAERLLSLGRRRIAYIGGTKTEAEVKERYIGFESALEAAGMKVDPRIVVHGDYTERSGVAAMEELLDRDPSIDAVFCNSDLMAIAAMGVLAREGLRVPEDIAVIGYDDLTLASYVTPALTTVSQRIPFAGKLLARDLVAFLEQGVITATTVPVELIVRDSA